MKVLIIMGGFFPGQKFGGPPVSVDNFCSLLKDECDCFIVTSNHDMDNNNVYPNIHSGWNDRGNCKVLYLSDKEYRYKKFEAVIKEISPDIIYLQGLFQYCVIPCLRLAKKYNISVMLAPRGELCSGAFKKKYKKIPYIVFLRTFNLLKNVHFQSTSDEESEAIQKILAVDKERVHFMTNIPSIPKDRNIYVDKKEGEARLIFISRIVPKKNLHMALNYLHNVKGKVTFDIYGSLEDEQYWSECRKKIAGLPENIKVEYKGSISHDEVHDTFKRYDAFLFPTLSENFGHVIAEALMVGCPVIISDQTPWTDVNNIEGGWSIALENPKEFVVAIQIIVNANCEQEKIYKKHILNYIEKKLNLTELKELYYNGFENAVVERR